MKLTSLSLLLFALAAPASAATVFTMEPVGPVYAGQSFIINVTATTDLMYAFMGDFSFTAGLLQVDNVTGAGDFGSPGFYGSDPIDNTNGAVTNFYATRVGSGGSTGVDVLVARIFATALTKGDGTVSFAPAFVVTNPDSFDSDPTVSATPANFTITTTPETAPL